jgi:hypothetical protein
MCKHATGTMCVKPAKHVSAADTQQKTCKEDLMARFSTLFILVLKRLPALITLLSTLTILGQTNSGSKWSWDWTGWASDKMWLGCFWLGMIGVKQSWVGWIALDLVRSCGATRYYLDSSNDHQTNITHSFFSSSYICHHMFRLSLYPIPIHPSHRTHQFIFSLLSQHC